MAARLDGAAHILFQQGKKAKRISHGTSHAESLANYIVVAAADMIGLRLTELNWPRRRPTLRELIDTEAIGRYDIPIDAVTDCRDLYELVTGQKGDPQDRTQRLIVMSLRERRLLQRTRAYIWVDTKSMMANALTKVIPVDPLLDDFMSTGTMRLPGHAQLRWSVRRSSCDERDIASLSE